MHSAHLTSSLQTSARGGVQGKVCFPFWRTRHCLAVSSRLAASATRSQLPPRVRGPRTRAIRGARTESLRPEDWSPKAGTQGRAGKRQLGPNGKGHPCRPASKGQEMLNPLQALEVEKGSHLAKAGNDVSCSRGKGPPGLPCCFPEGQVARPNRTWNLLHLKNQPVLLRPAAFIPRASPELSPGGRVGILQEASSLWGHSLPQVTGIAPGRIHLP